MTGSDVRSRGSLGIALVVGAVLLVVALSQLGPSEASEPGGAVEVGSAHEPRATEVPSRGSASVSTARTDIAPESAEREESPAVAVGSRFRVRVRHASGALLPNFGVAIHRGEDELAHASTDASGEVEVLLDQIHAGGSVRLQPRGWVGDRSTFPIVDAAAPPAGVVELTVPPFGYVDFEPMRDGVPTAEPLAGRIRVEMWFARGETERNRHRERTFLPIEVGQRFRCGPVAAAGLRLECMVTLRRIFGVPFRGIVAGPEFDGEVRTVPLELGRDEGSVTFRMIREGGRPLGGGSVKASLFVGAPDRAPWRATRTLKDLQSDADGIVTVPLTGTSGDGDILHWIRVDAAWPAAPDDPGGRSERRMNGRLDVGRSPEPGAALGDVVLGDELPSVSGVVLSESGTPVSGAAVCLVSSRGLHEIDRVSGVARTDQDGRFTLWRDEFGSGSMRLHVETGEAVLHDHGPVRESDYVTVTLGGQGALRVSFADGGGFGGELPVVELRQAGAAVRHLGRPVRPADGVWIREGLPAGRYDIRLRNGPYGEDLFTVKGVEVVAGVTCVDPRLQQLWIAQWLRPVRIRVLDHYGRPLPGAAVERELDHEADSWHSRKQRKGCDVQGYVEFSVPVASDRVVASAEADGYSTQRLELPLGQSRGVVQLRPVAAPGNR